MPKVQAETSIDFLVRRRFPGSHAPPPIGAPAAEREAWQVTKKQREDYHAELRRLSAPELGDLVSRQREAAKREDIERREKLSSPAYPPEFSYWLRQEEWSLAPASLLLTEVDPVRGLGVTLLIRMAPPVNARSGFDPVAEFRANNDLSDRGREALQLAREIVSNAESAARKGSLTIRDRRVTPREFLLWARSRGYTIPAPLHALFNEVPTVAELQGRIRSLEAQLAAQQDSPARIRPDWMNAQLWTLLEAAYLLAGRNPPTVPMGQPSEDIQLHFLEGNAKIWYGELKDASDLNRFKVIDSRTGHIGNRRVTPEDCLAWAKTRNRPIAANLSEVATARTVDVTPKDRKSLLTLVIAMATQCYKYDPRVKKGTVVGEIVADAEKCGLAITDDTVRKWLTESSKLIDDDQLDVALNKKK